MGNCPATGINGSSRHSWVVLGCQLWSTEWSSCYLDNKRLSRPGGGVPSPQLQGGLVSWVLGVMSGWSWQPPSADQLSGEPPGHALLLESPLPQPECLSELACCFLLLQLPPLSSPFLARAQPHVFTQAPWGVWRRRSA